MANTNSTWDRYKFKNSISYKTEKEMLFRIANKNAILKRHNLFTFYTFCATIAIIMPID